MKINWKSIFELEQKQFEAMSEAERFVYFLLLQYKGKYLWGKETPEGSDCSGAVCLALCASTGLLIRTTANDLYKRVFTKPQTKNGINAAFFIDKKNTAVHVAGLLDEGVVLNSQEPTARIRALPDISKWFEKEGCRTEIRGLDRAALEKLSREGKTVYDLDGEFKKYFEV
ncbi:MAG: C40 family peptidase [Spirochaetaceae bacterium]|jgi:murein DD-endopeptidase|nr:C40 family peptidase [Spirochaetaceae bacterium]